MNESISFVIPTLNASDTIESCLQSIVNQDYPKDKIEILIIDGYSSDNTVQLAKELTGKHDVSFKIYQNPNKTCEAGKQIGIREAKNEIIGLIDSDNILEGRGWIKKMIEPFENPEITGSEPLYFTYRRSDSLITRYCALLGANDPMCYYLGNYDRYSKLSERWTGLDVSTKDKGNYIVAELDEKNIPTIGANGFLFRKEIYKGNLDTKYFFDIDEVYKMVLKGYNKFAKVKTGIIHIYADNIKDFIKKQKRRILDYRYYKERKLRVYPWGNNRKLALCKFAIFSIIPVIPLWDTIKGYIKLRDKAWFFHPIACFLTLTIYIIFYIKAKFKNNIYDRSKW
jgi:glycosyltransferase involved in cell wall biosynthesis